MVEPCAPKAKKQEKGGREKLLCSLKDIIKLVEEDASSGERCVPECPCPCNEKKSEFRPVKGPPCPPDAMVRCEDN